MSAKEHPMLFSGDLVRALLDGRKTVTRRPIKPSNSIVDLSSPTTWPNVAPHKPRIKPGDRIWVRETFCLEHEVDGIEHDPPHSDGRPVRRRASDEHSRPTWEQPHYRATDPRPELVYSDMSGEEICGCRWTPSIHMPRWASRITLVVVDVRAERLQDITEDGAFKEGVEQGKNSKVQPCSTYSPTFREGFYSAWNGIYGHDGLSWDANPWVWVIEFKRAEAGQ